MSLVLFDGPDEEPVSVAEMEDHLGVANGQDGTLLGLLQVARRHVEEISGRALLPQTWDLVLDAFPCVTGRNPFGAFILNRVPVQSITSITYIDEAGASIVLASLTYTLDLKSEPARLVPAYDKEWPDTRAVPNAVTVRFLAGYADVAAVPDAFKQVIKIEAATLYEHREDVLVGTTRTPLDTIRRLLAPWRLYPSS